LSSCRFEQLYIQLTLVKFYLAKFLNNTHWIYSTIKRITLLEKTKHEAGSKHEGDGKLRHPHRTIGKIRHLHRSGRSIYVDDEIFRHIHVLVLSHAWLFLQCTK
jgi:hypothetical protein